MKRRRLGLRRFTNFAKHFARTCKVETALRLQLTQRRQHVMRAVDVRIHRREAVAKTFRHETLRRQVITLSKLVLADDVKDRRVTLETRRVQHNLVEQMPDARETSLRILERDASD